MKNEVWFAVNTFLNELRCENTGRETFLKQPEYQCAVMEKIQSYKRLEKTLTQAGNKMFYDDFISSIEKCIKEECQQAYLQGIIDGILIIAGIGNVPCEEIVEKVKKGLD